MLLCFFFVPFLLTKGKKERKNSEVAPQCMGRTTENFAFLKKFCNYFYVKNIEVPEHF